MENTLIVQRATPENVHQLAEMLDTVYRPQLKPGEGMTKEFPHLFHKDNAANLYYTADGERPVSMVGVYPQEVIFQGISMPVISIGCVCTLPEYERKGLSSAILNQVIDDFTARNVPLMFVSGDRGLYRRAGCVPVGAMHVVKATRNDTAELASKIGAGRGYIVQEVSAADRQGRASVLAPLYRREAYRYRRTDAQMSVLLNALWFPRPNYDQRLVEVLHAGEVVAYAVAYVSKRQPDVVEVMEWAGSRSAFLASLDAVLDNFQAERVHWHVHVDDQEMRNQVSCAGLQANVVPLQGTVRVLNVEALFKEMQPIFRERWGGNAEVETTSGRWKVTLPNDIVRTFDHREDLTTWLFSHEAHCLGIPLVHTDDLNYI